MAVQLVTDPLYLSKLQQRMQSGNIAPAVEVHLWHMAFGKPKEQIEVKKATAVRIIHSYADDLGEKIAKEVIEGELTTATDQDHQDAVEHSTDSVLEDKDEIR